MKTFEFSFWIQRNDDWQDREIKIKAKDIKHSIDIFFEMYPFGKIRRIDCL